MSDILDTPVQVRPQVHDLTRIAAFPRVDLLPPEIKQAQAFRRAQLAMGGVLASAVLIVGALYVPAHSSVSTAQTGLDTEQARGAELAARAAESAHVRITYRDRDLAVDQLEQAMGQEVRWSGVLADLDASLPERVWLTDLQVTQQVADGTAAPVGGTEAGQQPTAVTGATDGSIGTITFIGKAMSARDVAAWLDSLAEMPGFTSVTLTTTTTDPGLTPKVYAFTTTATLTSELLSNRYTSNGSE